LGSSAHTNVWILTPGFAVGELPVKLSNINNLQFSPVGRLTALGYDVRVYILSDSDGDGIEDGDRLFWDKPTLSVPVLSTTHFCEFSPCAASRGLPANRWRGWNG